MKLGKPLAPWIRYEEQASQQAEEPQEGGHPAYHKRVIDYSFLSLSLHPGETGKLRK